MAVYNMLVLPQRFMTQTRYILLTTTARYTQQLISYMILIVLVPRSPKLSTIVHYKSVRIWSFDPLVETDYILYRAMRMRCICIVP